MNCTCTKCQQTKPRSEFYDRENATGYRRQCKLCVLERVRNCRASPEARAEFNRKNREYVARRDVEKRRAVQIRQFENFYVTQKGRATHMFNNMRSRSRQLGVEMTIDREWIAEKLRNGVCEVTGLPFVFFVGGGKGHITNPFSPSIERKERLGGYTPDNAIMTCWIYNRAKGGFTQADFDRMCVAYVARLTAEQRKSA